MKLLLTGEQTMNFLLTVAQYYTDYSTTYDSTYSDSSATGAVGLVFILLMLLLSLVLTAVVVVGMWKVFEKAGRPGWAAIVPFYNYWVLFEIAGFPGWWALFGLVPIANFFPAVIQVISYFKIAKLFGKSDGFAIANAIFSPIVMLILGFGKDKFQGAAPAQTPVTTSGPVANQ